MGRRSWDIRRGFQVRHERRLAQTALGRKPGLNELFEAMACANIESVRQTLIGWLDSRPLKEMCDCSRSKCVTSR